MKKNIKSLIGVLLCLVMLMSLMGTAAFADDPSFNSATGVLSGIADGNYYAVQGTDPSAPVDWVEISGSQDGCISIPAESFVGAAYILLKENAESAIDTWTILQIGGVTENDPENDNTPLMMLFRAGNSSISFVITGSSTAELQGVQNDNYYGIKQKNQTDAQTTWTKIEGLTADNKVSIENLEVGMAVGFNPVNKNNDNLQWFRITAKSDKPVSGTDYKFTTKIDDAPAKLEGITSGLEYSQYVSGAWTEWNTITAGDNNLQANATKVRVRRNVAATDGNYSLPSEYDEYEIVGTTTYPLWIKGTQVTSANYNTEEDWTYYPSVNVLQINNNITAYYDADATKNQLKEDAAIYYNGNPANPQMFTIAGKDGKTPKITADNFGKEIDSCIGIHSTAPMKLAGKLEIIAKDATVDSLGVYCPELTIDATGTIIATAGQAGNNSYGVKAENLVQDPNYPDDSSKHIDIGKIYVKGSLTGNGGKAKEQSFGICSMYIEVQNDTANLIGNSGEAEKLSSGIAAYNKLTIADGTVNGKSATSLLDSEGIYAKEIVMQDGTVEAEGGTGAAKSAGINASTFTITDGSVTAKAGMSMQYCEGIIADSFTVNGGNVMASSCLQETYANNHAISSTNAIELLGGCITANAAGTNGIGINADIKMKGNAKLVATSSNKTPLASVPDYTTYSYNAKVMAGANKESATQVPADKISAGASYQKNYVEITAQIATIGFALEDDFDLGYGESRAVEVTFNPETATDTELVWSSSDTDVVTVDKSTGVVRGVGEGTARVTAKLKSSIGKAQEITDWVEIDVSKVHVTSIELDADEITLPQGETATITYSIEPTTASEQRASVSSANTNVATVTGTGSSKTVTITGVNTGSTTINFETIDGKKTASCVVNVTAKTYVTGIAIADATGSTPKSITLTTKGAAQTLYAVVAPATATNKAVEWSVTGDNTVVYLTNKTDSSCVVNAYGNGTAVLTATAKDGSGKVATLNITVQDTQSTYKFTYKENSGVWYYDYGTLATYTVKCDGPYSSFSGCLMDGYIVSPSYYYVTEGSTIVTFYPAYMQTLSHGRHTLTFVYNGTTTVSTYIWSRSLRDPPITGDSGTAGLIAAMSVSALAAASCTFFVRKKKEN